ncbi:unnamed protein product [Moneuplotes crassus]|uniref:Uncharacterized protein n=1 Tax=Euplotes crassus TaxID=5936 RepID=A0AAD1UB28_EUPCR|nr:unnamed protein product [Moneuplotes crassus]
MNVKNSRKTPCYKFGRTHSSVGSLKNEYSLKMLLKKKKALKKRKTEGKNKENEKQKEDNQSTVNFSRPTRTVLGSDIKNTENLELAASPSNQSPSKYGKLSSFMKYQNKTSRSNLLNSSRESYSMFTPKSTMSNREGSNERNNLFKFKRQLHKNNKGNISAEVPDFDDQKELHNTSMSEPQDQGHFRSGKNDQIIQFLMKENNKIKGELNTVKAENSLLKEQYLTLNSKVDHLLKAVRSMSKEGSPTADKMRDIQRESVLCEDSEPFTIPNRSFDGQKKKTSIISKVCVGLVDESCADFSKGVFSPKEINLVRNSHASPMIFSEKIDLNKKRYDYKMAKNSSVDNMGCLSQGYESTDGAKPRGAKGAKGATMSVGDHLSVNSERPKARYHKPTLDSHNKIGTIKGVAKSRRNKLDKSTLSEQLSQSEIENNIPQMSKLFDGKSENLRASCNLSQALAQRPFKKSFSKAPKSINQKVTKAVSIDIEPFNGVTE